MVREREHRNGPVVVGVGLVCRVYSWGGGGRAGELGIFLGWWGSGW